MKNKSMTAFLSLLVVFSVGVSPARAKMGTKRSLDQILGYTLFGITLNTPVEVAQGILADQGFSWQGEAYPDQRKWTFKKGQITIHIEARLKGPGLHTIAVTENGPGGRLDVGAQVTQITSTWGESGDGKPVCTTREMKGKVVLAECGVADDSNREAAFYAMLSIAQFQQRIALLAFE